jgi:hypothetical protein
MVEEYICRFCGGRIILYPKGVAHEIPECKEFNDKLKSMGMTKDEAVQVTDEQLIKEINSCSN